MELYQRIVMGIAIVLLIAAYIMIYFTLVDNNKKWPPSVAKCPDYWVYNSTTDQCVDSSDSNNYYPSNPGETLTQKSSCEKFKWAKDNEISWEGLSYGVSINCP